MSARCVAVAAIVVAGVGSPWLLGVWLIVDELALRVRRWRRGP